MDTLLQTNLTEDQAPSSSNTFSILSALAAFGGVPLMIALGSGRGWDGLAYLLLGVPASAGLGFLLGLIACVRKESAGPLVTLSIVALVAIFFLFVIR